MLVLVFFNGGLISFHANIRLGLRDKRSSLFCSGEKIKFEDTDTVEYLLNPVLIH